MVSTTVSADDVRAPAGPWRAVGVATFAVAGFLLLSFGGAIAAAPVTLPLMFVASRRHPTRAFRTAAAVLGGLTAAEAGWAVTYVVLGDAKPWIWLLPLAVTIGAAWFLSGLGRNGR